MPLTYLGSDFVALHVVGQLDIAGKSPMIDLPSGCDPHLDESVVISAHDGTGLYAAKRHPTIIGYCDVDLVLIHTSQVDADHVGRRISFI